MIKCLIAILVTWGLGGADASTSTEPKRNSDAQILASTIAKYKKAKLVTLNLEQITTTVLGKEKISAGKAYMAATRFRIDIQTPEVSKIVFDGKSLWREWKLPPEMGGEAQVAKTEVAQKTQEFFFMSYLLKSKTLERDATLVKSESTKEVLVFEIKNDNLSAKSLKIHVIPSDKVVSELVVVDDIDQVTRVKFDKTVFSSKPKSSLFRYSPPKGTKVMSL